MLYFYKREKDNIKKLSYSCMFIFNLYVFYMYTYIYISYPILLIFVVKNISKYS